VWTKPPVREGMKNFLEFSLWRFSMESGCKYPFDVPPESSESRRGKSFMVLKSNLTFSRLIKTTSS
jgi:hypothetical protein